MYSLEISVVLRLSLEVCVCLSGKAELLYDLYNILNVENGIY